jgi:hypothetical protein
MSSYPHRNVFLLPTPRARSELENPGFCVHAVKVVQHGWETLPIPLSHRVSHIQLGGAFLGSGHKSFNLKHPRDASNRDAWRR